MAMWKRERVTALLVEDCESVLAGTYVERLVDAGAPVPPWAWVSLLAHGTAQDLYRARHPSSARAGGEAALWWQARAHLATVVLDAARRTPLATLQAAVLVPLELQLMAEGLEGPSTPGELVDVVLAALDGAGATQPDV
jgi:hypothetical protein